MGKKLCQYCRRYYKVEGLGTHQKACKYKIAFKKRLDELGIIAEPKKGLLHISGGMKIYLALGRNDKTEEDKQFKKILEKTEKDYGITISYDINCDKLTVVEHN